MINHLRTMSKVVIVALGVSILIAVVASSQKPTKYKISIPHYVYYTNSYTSNGNCITFKNECGCKDEKTITICGNYTIITR